MIKPAPLTKDEFIKVLQIVANLHKKESDFCDALDSLTSGDFPSQCLIYETPITTIIDMLARMFCEDPTDEKKSAQFDKIVHYDFKAEEDISYFLFEAGAIYEKDIAAFRIPKDNCPTDKDGKILYSDVRSLYDYLIGE